MKKLLKIIKRGLRYIIKGVPIVRPKIVYTNSSQKLKGKNILITGGSSGIGFSIAKKSVEEGANVVITGRNEKKLKEAVGKISESCKFLVWDVKDVKSTKEMLIEAEKLIEGNFDCLVSNAGISLHEGSFENVTEETWDAQMDINLKGNYFLTKTFAESMVQNKIGNGNILVISSERANRSDDIPYGISKVGTNSFVKAMASKLINKGIRINVLSPGVTLSDMIQMSNKDSLYESYQPQKRIFLPEEMAEVACFLLSDISNCISGEVITCDQGRYISTW